MAVSIFEDESSPVAFCWRPAHERPLHFISDHLGEPYCGEEAIWDLDTPWKKLFSTETEKRDDEYYDRFHASRIAGWVHAICAGYVIQPCKMEFGRDFTGMNDGNHRYQALRHLSYSHFPVECSGTVRAFEEAFRWSDKIKKNFDILEIKTT